MFELRLLSNESGADALSDALMDELGALSVSVEDADADTDDEQALFGEPDMPAPRQGWQRSVLRALFATEDAATEAAALLLAQQGDDGTDDTTDNDIELHVLSLAKVDEQDWVRLTQSQFSPVEITPTFWIVPSWHQAPEAARTVIALDPGLAFGTGTHPTTRMCLRWIATHAPALSVGWDRVLDYGCGSGILAIGAALHGARGIDAVDIDPAAVEATGLNAAANGAVLTIGLPDIATNAYPLVLANILATPLKLLAPLLVNHVRPGGHLVLAGILERQADELAAAYAPWCALTVGDTQDGWILMTAKVPEAR